MIEVKINDSESNVYDDMGSVSDGYHTFDELYHHRAILFSVICNQNKDLAWKSKKHDTGDMYDGMFIVGIETPYGQATYHYDIDPYWDMFDVKELPNAPVWDGHTPDEAINRISTLSKINVKSEAIDRFANRLKDDIYRDRGNPYIALECKKCGIWKAKEINDIAKEVKEGSYGCCR